MRHLGWAVAAFVAIAASPQANANILITVDKSTQRMSVQVDGVPRWNWRVSTGAAGYDTPSGTWRTFRMEASHFSKEFDDAPMPHSIFFTKKGHAIHGYLNTSHLGLPVSHGCVRLDPQNATALYALVKEQGVLNTTVIVTGHVSSDAIARRGAPSYPQSQPTYQESQRYGTPSYSTPSYGTPTYSTPSYGNRYGSPYSGDDRFMSSSNYSEPPQPPPGYPPYPRPYR
jgi:hypothetical protein